MSHQNGVFRGTEFLSLSSKKFLHPFLPFLSKKKKENFFSSFYRWISIGILIKMDKNIF